MVYLPIKQIEITYKNYKVFFIVFLLLSIISFSLAINSFIKVQLFLKSAATANGIVIRNLEEEGFYKSVIQFTTKNGEQIEYLPQSGSKPARFSVGETVKIFYLEDNPSEVKIGTNDNLFSSVHYFAFAGTIFAVFVIFFLIFKKNKFKPITGLWAAKIICISFIISGLFLIFLGSNIWFNQPQLIIGGLLFFAFGFFIYSLGSFF